MDTLYDIRGFHGAEVSHVVYKTSREHDGCHSIREAMHALFKDRLHKPRAKPTDIDGSLDHPGLPDHGRLRTKKVPVSGA